MTRDTRLFEKPRLRRFRVLIDMMQVVMDAISNAVSGVFDILTTERGTIFVTLVGMVFSMLALQGWVPVIVGSVALGLLAGQAFRPLLQTSSNSTRTETIEKMVPYNEWPNECYACGQPLGSVRGQLVVHKGDNANSLKAVGLCETCTRTHSTLLDYSDEMEEIFDSRGDPEEL
jgi:hypothetical protein